ncbi:DUF998 domain-containing protein [Oceanospirillum sediminis]|uniref:DUF998 domain-containing protein n=1 Tax=Oceanospirillum sediminis TaxID=2760088 RepID=A0A839IW48_9GAMM|nr:DUF998 domain-containing protein [Oceanospirillum sediminis]MBB1489178.1 DUF998 domain-containing protein [Oceanospirillum sediminis]
MESFIPYTGLIASVWIVAGIYIASLFYPGYSHSRQFCSELGAVGSPTQKLSPIINNYPLGLLFVLFGYYLASAQLASSTDIAIGAMVITHGLCTWVCGYFPMDADPYTSTPSTKCNIHSWSGVVMLVSFIVAPAIVVFSGLYPTTLRILSLLCLTGCFYFSYTLAGAFKAKSNPGFHQRLSYGFQILWLFIFSYFAVA